MLSRKAADRMGFIRDDSVKSERCAKSTVRGCVESLLLLLMTGWTAAADSAQTALEQDDRKAILILGDSLAAGFGLEDPVEAFPSLLQKKIAAAALKFTVINGGVSGDTSAGGLRRIDWTTKRKIDVLVLELGGNDGLRGISPDATKTNLQAIIDRTKTKYPNVQVVIAGMQMPPNLGPDYTNRFQRIFPELARANRAVLIPFLLEGVGGRPELNLPDRIHPNAEGHARVAENVWKVLKPLLGKPETKDDGTKSQD